jgi:AhpD family alkylhydroperoxidase
MKLFMIMLSFLIGVLVTAEYTNEEKKEAKEYAYNKVGAPKDVVIEPIDALVANSPIAGKAVVDYNIAIVKSKIFDSKQIEIVSLAVSVYNDCQFCAAFHGDVATKAGVSTKDVEEVKLGGLPTDSKLRFVVQATRKIMTKKGFLSKADKAYFHSKGVDQPHLVEIGAIVGALTAFNYINHINELDIPGKELQDALAKYDAYENFLKRQREEL